MNDNLFKRRMVFLNGAIDDISANFVIEQLFELEYIDPHKDISLLINSQGGSVAAGMALMDVMNFVKCDVRTIGIGVCASMAGFLLTCGTKGKRLAFPSVSVMLHQLHSRNEGQATDLAILAEHATQTKNKMEKIVAKNCNQPLDIVEELMERDTYFTSNEALDFGIIDRIIQ